MGSDYKSLKINLRLQSFNFGENQVNIGAQCGQLELSVEIQVGNEIVLGDSEIEADGLFYVDGVFGVAVGVHVVPDVAACQS